jgi:TonB family protein
MNKILFVCCCICFFAVQLNAQTSKDSSFTEENICWKGEKENGKKNGEWIATDCKTGIKKISTFYLVGKKEGTETHYQQNGKLQSIYTYAQDKLNGRVIHFTPVTADTLAVINYNNDAPEGEWRFFNWRGKQIETIYIKNNQIETGSPFAKFTRIKLPPTDYQKYLNIAQKYIGIYYVNQIDFPSAVNDTSTTDTSKVYFTSQITDSSAKLPEYLGGETEMMKLLQNNVIYPISAKETGRKGTIYITFIINKDGTISNEEIVHTSSGIEKKVPELAGEAIRIVTLLPPYTPASINGKPIKVRIVLPIKFILK